MQSIDGRCWFYHIGLREKGTGYNEFGLKLEKVVSASLYSAQHNCQSQGLRKRKLVKAHALAKCLGTGTPGETDLNLGGVDDGEW